MKEEGTRLRRFLFGILQLQKKRKGEKMNKTKFHSTKERLLARTHDMNETC